MYVCTCFKKIGQLHQFKPTKEKESPFCKAVLCHPVLNIPCRVCSSFPPWFTLVHWGKLTQGGDIPLHPGIPLAGSEHEVNSTSGIFTALSVFGGSIYILHFMSKLSFQVRMLDIEVPRCGPCSVYILVTMILLRVTKLPPFFESRTNYYLEALSFQPGSLV